MSITDWIIILLFLGGLIAIGFAFSKKNKDLKDYFLAGKSMPTWLVVFAATGTSISAGTFVGSPELGFNTNLTFIMSCVGAVIGGVVPRCSCRNSTIPGPSPSTAISATASAKRRNGPRA